MSTNQPTNQPTNTITFEEACRCYLTETEVRVLKLVMQGFSSIEIADSLGNTPSTIQTHRKNIKRKLNLRGHRSLIKWSRKYTGEIHQYPIKTREVSSSK
ncbi:MAG: LuxR family transcriptional regulator [Balneolaceae bacterium]|nr:MAG: LuxR family transcriptional regulator [Balneolaceae bacterium]